MRPAGVPAAPPLRPARGGSSVLRQRGDAVLRERADALGGGDARLHDGLHRARHAGEALGHDVVATLDVTLHRVAVAADDALDAGPRLAHVALELVARGDAAALVAALQPLE